jgi:hypothetical protein
VARSTSVLSSAKFWFIPWYLSWSCAYKSAEVVLNYDVV